MDDGTTWLSIADAATITEVSRQTIHVWISQGRVRQMLTEDGIRVDGRDLARATAEREAAAMVGVRRSTLRLWSEETTYDAG